MEKFSAMFRPVFLLASIAVVFAAGCASGPSEKSVDAAPSDVVAVAATNVIAVPPPVAPEPVPPVAAPEPVPAPKPKPWTIQYEAGHQLAKFDGINVYLGKPAESNWKSRKAFPSAVDKKTTVSPLVSGRSAPLATARPMRICLDPGHGGVDSGALSKDAATAERDVTLDIAMRVKRLLEKDGSFVVMLTRGDNKTDQLLPQRPSKAKNFNADAFISIHLNANASSVPHGIETYLCPAYGTESTGYAKKKASAESKLIYPGNAHDGGNMQLAFCIQRRLIRETKKEDRGVKRARFVVLREAEMPAALVECGFISNASDLAYLRSESGRDKIARGIYDGICDFCFGTIAPGLPARSSVIAAGPAPHAPSAGAPAQTPAAAPAQTGPVEFVPSAERIVAPSFIEGAVPVSSPGVRDAALRAAGLVP